jgi:hypothetical protein
VILRRAARQDLNPRVLVLDKCVAPSTASSMLPVAVRYDEQTVAKYTQVRIEPDALFIDVVVAS